MRGIASSLLVVVSLALAGCGTATSTRVTPQEHRTVRPDVIRAVWVDSWGRGLWSAAEVDELVKWCTDHGFNTILAEVRKAGDAYYTSLREPAGTGPGGRPLAKGFDPLDHLIEKARPHGLRIEAWLVAHRVWKGSGEPPATWPRHVLAEHPEWTLRDVHGGVREAGADGNVFVDPAIPGVRRHLAEVAADIVKRYPVDAIHLDYIRYPGRKWGYGEQSLARYRRETGASGVPEPADDAFTAWRAEKVTDAVGEVRAAIKNVRRDVDLTVATVTWGDVGRAGYRGTRGYRDAMQDWPAWCERGLVDVLYTMHYKREHVAAQKESYRRWFDLMRRCRSTRTRVVIGQGSYLNDIGNSVVQIRDALEAGFDGFCVFSYRTTNRGQSTPHAFGRAVSRVR